MKKTESSNERKDMCSAICIYQLPDLLIEKVNREGMTSMKIHIMKTVSEGTRQIIMRRARMEGLDVLFQEHSALAVLNGNVCDLIYASDLAQKASDVEVFESSGNCPHHLTCLAILGSASAVDEAVKRINSESW